MPSRASCVTALRLFLALVILVVWGSSLLENSVDELLVCFIVTFASFVVGCCGMGFAMISTSILVPIVGVRTGQPLVALLSAIVYLITAVRADALRLNKEIGIMLTSTVVAMPLGLWYVSYVDRSLVLHTLGCLLLLFVGYGVYVLLSAIKADALELSVGIEVGKWTVFFGIISGLLGGAFNINGPPVAVYSHYRNFSQTEYRNFLLAFQMPSSVFTVFMHIAIGLYDNEELFILTAKSLPGLLLGQYLGLRLFPHVDQLRFRLSIYALLALVALKLLIS